MSVSSKQKDLKNTISGAMSRGQVADPIKFSRLLWPHVRFYKEQEDLIYSVVENKETICVAGNELGKDFTAGFLVLWWFLTRHPVKVVTTSADFSQLEAVLWGEIRRFIQSSAIPLIHTKGGPLVVNHLHLRKLIPGTKEICGVSYAIGRVAKKGEGMLGHHVTEDSSVFTDDGIPRTFFVADEASGVDDVTYDRSTTWADRKLIIGNPFPCTNFFYKKVETEGDKPIDKHDLSKGYYQKIITIEALNSPNVRVGLAEEQAGKQPTGKSIVPGVLSHADYKTKLVTLDPIMLCIGVHAKFWKGKEVLLYPPEWLNRAARIASDIRSMHRVCKGIGVDPAEGGDKTAFAAVDEYGLIDLEAHDTPDSTVIPGLIKAFARKHGFSKDEADRTVLDRGGGGSSIASYLRRDGWDVRTVGFGEPVNDRKHFETYDDEDQRKETRYVYFNRRAQLYGRLRELLDPTNEQGFALPPGFIGLRKQLAPIPLLYDKEGRMIVPQKRPETSKKYDREKGVKQKTLIEIIGHSPDEAEALMIAIYAMNTIGETVNVGPMFKNTNRRRE